MSPSRIFFLFYSLLRFSRAGRAYDLHRRSIDRREIYSHVKEIISFIYCEFPICISNNARINANEFPIHITERARVDARLRGGLAYIPG